MNKVEFEKLMEQIDKELRAKEVPIHARPIHAIGEVGKRLKIGFIFAPQPAPAVAGRYDSNTLAAHINKWYDDHYGDRLKIHHGPGSAVLLIRGDPWKIIFPRLYGAVTLACDPDLERYRNSPRVSVGKSPRIYCNVLNCIEGLPERLAKTLTEAERREIINFFKNTLDILHQLESITDRHYLNEAMADLQSAVSNILARPPQYGLCKWASLQFIEKLLKAFIQIKGGAVPKHHILQNIAREAEGLGLATVDHGLLSKIQCTAGVRYGEETVKLSEAIAAHHTSLELAKNLAHDVKGA